MVVTETEEMEEKTGQGRAMPENAVNAVVNVIEETVEEDVQETIEETIEETVDEEDTERHETKVKKGKHQKIRHQKVETQHSHFRKLFEWLLPYCVATVLVIISGSVVLLFYNFKTQRLYRQLQEQYGEYFADE